MTFYSRKRGIVSIFDSVNRVYCASGYPRHVGRNYVPLFDVDTDLRYYVIRDVIVL